MANRGSKRRVTLHPADLQHTPPKATPIPKELPTHPTFKVPTDLLTAIRIGTNLEIQVPTRVPGLPPLPTLVGQDQRFPVQSQEISPTLRTWSRSEVRPEKLKALLELARPADTSPGASRPQCPR
mmetsp:Transcript_51825/g.112662  ORF Transcript_51825/g.112662 Transcript_51825/m.112662 type:complete len:125 (-) Transcript_51825:2125-2499(-)